MAELLAAAERDNIFVYLGGEQEVPDDITHVIIDRSVKIIPEAAFGGRTQLVSVETHDGIEKIEKCAFADCDSLRGIKLPGVKEIEGSAFWGCRAMTVAEFGNKLETIGECAFVFCPLLQRIAIPLKNEMFLIDTDLQRYNQFDECENLTTVDLVGGIHKTIVSLLLESWRDEMNQEINRVNRMLPNTPVNAKTAVIQEWIRSVINRMEHYKAEHNRLLKEDMTQLELVLWKAKLDVEEEEDSNSNVKVQAKKAKIDVEGKRREKRITSGASIVIKNVLPFLQLG
jgi:hypothetical protein